MPFYPWDAKALDVYVEAMNDEHKQIVHYMNQLFDENTAGAPKDQISKTLKSLAETTIKHFQDEEAFMQRVEFPQFDVHKAIHVDLLTKFKGHMDAYLNGSESRLAPGFFEFLRMWLQAHIQHVDRKYGEHAKVHKRAA